MRIKPHSASELFSILISVSAVLSFLAIWFSR